MSSLPIKYIAISNDDLIATEYYDTHKTSHVAIWNKDTGTRIRTISDVGLIRSPFSPQEMLAVITNNQTLLSDLKVIIYNTKTWEIIKVCTLLKKDIPGANQQPYARRVESNYSMNQIAIRTCDNVLWVWEFESKNKKDESPEQKERKHPLQMDRSHACYDFTYNATGTLLATLQQPNKIALLDTRTWEQMATFYAFLRGPEQPFFQYRNWTTNNILPLHTTNATYAYRLTYPELQEWFTEKMRLEHRLLLKSMRHVLTAHRPEGSSHRPTFLLKREYKDVLKSFPDRFKETLNHLLIIKEEEGSVV